jgi:hypothetical protein
MTQRATFAQLAPMVKFHEWPARKASRDALPVASGGEAMTLLDQELAEIDYLLRRFQDAHQACVLGLAGTVVSAAALPVTLFALWLFGLGPILEPALLCIALLFCGLAFGLLAMWRRHFLFESIKSRCGKLQAAGFVVYKKRDFFRWCLAAAAGVPEQGQPLDIERLDPSTFRDLMA